MEERALKFCFLFKLKKNPCPWDVNGVAKWLTTLGIHSTYVDLARKSNIDGAALLDMDHEQLEVQCGIKSASIRNDILHAVRKERWEERDEKKALEFMERYRLARLETSK